MLREPRVHPSTLTIGEAQAVFASSAKTHLLLLADDGLLVAAVTRDDAEGTTANPAAPAASIGCLEGRTVSPDLPVEPLRETMAGSGMRRIAVVDEAGRLLGLLCLKKSLRGFCTDEGVAAMRAARETADALPRPRPAKEPG